MVKFGQVQVYSRTASFNKVVQQALFLPNVFKNRLILACIWLEIGRVKVVLSTIFVLSLSKLLTIWMFSPIFEERK